jgi:hypothetical protein
MHMHKLKDAKKKPLGKGAFQINQVTTTTVIAR